MESVSGEGSLTFLMEFFKDANFSDKVEKGDYPIALSLQDSVYIQVLAHVTFQSDIQLHFQASGE